MNTAALIAVDGASIEAHNNTFALLGLLKVDVIEVPKSEINNYESYEWLLLKEDEQIDVVFTQRHGIFWIVEGPHNTTHNFVNNTFNYVFCKRGCIYMMEAEGGTPGTTANFIGNNYNRIYGKRVGIL